MENLTNEAQKLIVEFKGNDYAFGTGVLDRVGSMTAEIGHRALLVSRLSSAWLKPALDRVIMRPVLEAAWSGDLTQIAIRE